MKRSRIEKLLVVIAWIGLIGGILIGALVSKGILESNLEMCVPRAFVTFAGALFVSVAGWAVLMQIVKISDRQRKIEYKLEEKKN